MNTRNNEINVISQSTNILHSIFNELSIIPVAQSTDNDYLQLSGVILFRGSCEGLL
jgi:hypothetical protein